MAKPKPLLHGNVSSKEGMSAAATNKKKNHKDCRKEHAPEPSNDPCTQQKDGAAVVAEATPLPPKGRGGTAKSRRRLARGPRSADLLHANGAPPGAIPCTNGVILQNPPPPPSSSTEDHRVVSTHFHDGATQAVLKVTILAAGFIIGARGISARLIGQVTGAVVHSWTERTSSACRPPPPVRPPLPPPVRLFRIEGKRASVQAAVALIQEAVSKYKELCECKRRGEFVQREHLIGGVEFYYHPPPRKALMASQSTPLPPMRKLSPPMPAPPPPSCAASNANLISGHPHAWNNMAPRLPSPPRPPSSHAGPSSQPFLLNWRLQPPSPPPLPDSLIGSGSAPPLPPPHLLPNFRPAPPPPQLHASGSTSSCMVSIEKSLHRVRLESNQPFSTKGNTHQNQAKLTELIPPPTMHYSLLQQQHQQQRQQYCSLFSVFGNGGHPVPIAQAAIPVADAGGSAAAYTRSTAGVPLPPNSGSQPLQAAATAFEFTACDFLRESLPLPLPAFVTASNRPPAAPTLRPSLCMPTAALPPQEYCLFGQQRCPSTGPLLMPPPNSQFNGDLSQWPPLMRSSHGHPSNKASSGC